MAFTSVASVGPSRSRTQLQRIRARENTLTIIWDTTLIFSRSTSVKHNVFPWPEKCNQLISDTGAILRLSPLFQCPHSLPSVTYIHFPSNTPKANTFITSRYATSIKRGTASIPFFTLYSFILFIPPFYSSSLCSVFFISHFSTVVPRGQRTWS